MCVEHVVQQNALNSSTAAAAAARITALTNKAEASNQPTQPASKNEENAINGRSLWWSAGNGPDVGTVSRPVGMVLYYKGNPVILN